MTDLVPKPTSIDRKALERIIQRAAELQAGEREIGDTLSEEQVLELGREVGLSQQHLRRALLEEREGIHDVSNTWLDRWMGPGRTTAQRTVPGNETDVMARLNTWMTERELLAVKRRGATWTSWEPRRDWIAGLKRTLGGDRHRYALAHTKDITATLQTLEPGWCHVNLMADLTNSRSDHLVGGAVATGFGVGITGVLFGLGFVAGAAVAPAGIGLLAAVGITRARRPGTERAHVALEQILDRLEHDDLKPPRLAPPKTQAISDVIRREIRQWTGQDREDSGSGSAH